MMNQRELIKEIPSGRFHSAIMTSFSINLYYWEIQLLRSLSSKGINFVSALVDSDCLSDQLFRYSKAFNGKKPLNFSLHGYKTKGAFHPKIQFYAGRDSVLALIGSGNLTVMGHGRNLEVWCPVLVDSINSNSYPFIRNVWSYLKDLYQELGPEANNIIRSIEENCVILREEYDDDNDNDSILGVNDNIRLFTNQKSSIFEKCQNWIGDDQINTITIMSPFFDSEAKLVKALYNWFKPQEIRLIIENGFGALPDKKCIPEYVKLYKWKDINKALENNYQEFFHSKCFFFDGDQNHYLLCGSANASVAAFGLPGVMPINQEACVAFKSSTTDYFQLTGFPLECLIDIDDFEASIEPHNVTRVNSTQTIWIKEASYINDGFELTMENVGEEADSILTFYAGDRSILYSAENLIKQGESIICGKFNNFIYPLYVEVTNKRGEMISNRQFMIPVEILDINNPSPESEYNRKRYRDIETGYFVNGEVLNFIENILNSNQSKLPNKNDSQPVLEKKIDDKDGFTFNSIEEYLKDDGSGITGNQGSRMGKKSMAQSTMLFDSMISYISRSFNEKENDDIDEEEEEDASTSSGRDKLKKQKLTTRTSKNANNTRDRIIKMFDRYIKNLENKAFPDNNEEAEISLLDVLKQYMTAVFFLYRTFSYRYKLDTDDISEHTLIELTRSMRNKNTATELFYRITSLFGLYLIKSKNVSEENRFIKQKINDYKQYAFELCLAVFSICDCLNDGNECYEQLIPYKAIAMLNLKDALYVDVDNHTSSHVYRRFDRSIQELDEFDKTRMQQYIDNNIFLLNNCLLLFPSIKKIDMFGYVDIKPVNDKVAILCTMACDYDMEKQEYCSDYRYIYESKRILKVIPHK